MSNRPRVAIVTGGSSGIGLATARQLREEGCRVVICARSEERVAGTIEVLGGGPDLFGVVADLGRAGDGSRLVERAVARFDALDVLVNAHGIQGAPGPIAGMPRSAWQEVLDVNLLGPIETMAAAIPHLRAAGGGAVVNVSSIDYMQTEPGIAPYGVSKAALVAFTKYAASESAGDGIRVNAVAPGWVRTPMTAPFLTEAGVDSGTVETNMLGRVAEPDELAQVICFLAGPAASYVTGETVVADGGQTVMLRAPRTGDVG
jgi:meso-butanediol dehydrogenase / (S,S)-butanediol dehydrogenase / diacetyl reductase